MPQPTDINAPDTWTCPVSAVDENTGAPVDISGDVVNVAFVPKGKPQPAPGAGVWVSCAWNPAKTAVILKFNQGAGSFILAELPGAAESGLRFYQGWVEVIDNPDQPILAMTDYLQVTGTAA
jgi:hypothetical protein